MRPLEMPAGPDQVIVVYESEDTGSMIEPATLWSEVAKDAETRAAQGWRILSTAVCPMRQMGTAGNIFFQSGGQFATQIALTVVFARG